MCGRLNPCFSQVYRPAFFNYIRALWRLQLHLRSCPLKFTGSLYLVVLRVDFRPPRSCAYLINMQSCPGFLYSFGPFSASPSG